MTLDKITVTAQNIDEVREELPCDQAAELEIGCETWGFAHSCGRGQITVWPNGRAAIEHGGDSVWADWDGNALTADDNDAAYDANGGETVLE